MLAKAVEVAGEFGGLESNRYKLAGLVQHINFAAEGWHLASAKTVLAQMAADLVAYIKSISLMLRPAYSNYDND